MDNRLYLDNAATSFPKPPRVYSAVLSAMTEAGANPGRGAHRMSLRAAQLLHRGEVGEDRPDRRLHLGRDALRGHRVDAPASCYALRGADDFFLWVLDLRRHSTPSLKVIIIN